MKLSNVFIHNSIYLIGSGIKQVVGLFSAKETVVVCGSSVITTSGEITTINSHQMNLEAWIVDMTSLWVGSIKRLVGFLGRVKSKCSAVMCVCSGDSSIVLFIDRRPRTSSVLRPTPRYDRRLANQFASTKYQWNSIQSSIFYQSTIFLLTENTQLLFFL